MTNITKFLLVCFCTLFSVSLSAQNNFWQNANASQFKTPTKERETIPNQYRVITLDTEAFLLFAEQAEFRFSLNKTNTLKMALPMPNGKSEMFTLEQTELMHPELATKFPELKTFAGKGVDDKTASIRITYSPYFGLSVMILSGKHSTVYIDAITTDNNHYISYYRDDLNASTFNFSCETDESIVGRERLGETNERVGPLGDCNLRRYRLAQSSNGEYSQYHISQAGGSTGTTAGDKAIVQAAMNIAIDRVNGIYERDLGITLQFIPNNDLVIYLNPNSDPWTNEFNTKTAQTLDNVIGVNNYDIGHNFNTTGGGSAGCLDCVCLSVSQNGNHKGRGYTGLPAPVGDPFYVDYVAHEMGHQFGGYHTQSNNSCRSGSGATEVEPGSGSTIMGYAGICSANVQNQSDDYFAYVNIRDIVTSINGGNGSGCAEVITSNNSGPSADAGSNYSIPISTPFKLEGVGSDPDDTGITYCWEQNDPESPNSNSAPSANRTQGPMFRSFDPVTVPYRYMPNLNAIINNNNPTWEVLPSRTRSMEFSFIVRDNNSTSGCTSSDLMSVNTINTAGPFLVNIPNTGLTWTGGTTETVTWDVSNTTDPPINCANVDILLSTDGGQTYTTTIAAGVTNDGSHDITVPNMPGTNNRIMIVCSDNIFFDISNTNFTILAGAPDFSIAATPTTNDVCSPNAIDYTINLNSIAGFNSAVTLSTIGVPIGATASFATNPVTPNGSSILTITSGTAATGPYIITVSGTGGGETHTTDITLNVLSGAINAPTLSSPSNGATDIALAAPLAWNTAASAATYNVEVATDVSFNNIVFSQSAISVTNATASGLSANTQYYWRVQAVNTCATSSWSNIFGFTTATPPACNDFIAEGGFESGANSAWSESSARGWQIVDNTSGNYNSGSWSAWLGGGSNETANAWQSVSISPTAISASLTYFYYLESNESAGDCIYDYGYLELNGTANKTYALCADTNTGGYVQETVDLSSFIGTTVEVRFKFTSDGSVTSSMYIDDVVLEVCENTLSVNNSILEGFVLYPNPNNGSFTIKADAIFNEAVSVAVYDVAGRQIFNKKYANASNFNEAITLNNVQAGIYLVKIKSGSKSIIKKIIVE
ncbi:MAG: reprolysin-like metallopeptidase [Oceanihabitans sp.]